MSLLVVGTAALDSIETPFGKKSEVIGGSGIFAAMAASFFTPVSLIAPFGEDFPQAQIEFLSSRGIDLSAAPRLNGPSFRWGGYYEYDMNQAHTRETRLNVLSEFDPRLPENLKSVPYVFLANIDPELQLKVLDQLTAPRLVVADTMDFWIKSRRQALHKVIRRVDYMVMNEGEIRQFMETPNIPLAARRLLELGCRGVIVKKGEHGALIFSAELRFAAPSYPQEELRDPTGAGDSFGGGFCGYLASSGDLSADNIRRGVIIGSVMASFNIEDFSFDRLRRLNKKDVRKRYEEIHRFSRFTELAAG